MIQEGLIATVALLTACVPIREVAVGPPHASRQPDCAVGFPRATVESLQRTHERVGEVCAGYLDDGGGPDRYVRYEIGRRVSQFGGDLAVIEGLCSVGRINGIRFAVLRARTTP